MTLTLILRFMLVLLALLAACAAGFIYARGKEERRSALQIDMLSSEIARMRRRTAHAETQAERAQARLSQEKRRNRRG